MSEHTPTPWLIARDGYSITTTDRKASYVAQVHPFDVMGKANAQFIVRACNCHKDLLDACKMCFTACYMSTADFLNADELEQLKATIDKANKET